jgi:AraC-like DNA-binding protein
MKILQFTLPVPDNKTIITKEESNVDFYPHLHRHNEVQLTWILKGEGTLIVDNSIHLFHQHEIYWIGANQSHVFKSEPSKFKNRETTKHTLDIFFSFDKQLSSFFSIPEIKNLKNFIEHHGTGFRVPDASVTGIAEKMLAVRDSSGVEQFFQFLSLLKQIAALEELAPLSLPSHESYSDHEGIRIANIYNYVMKHYKEDITLEEVAKIAYMTPQAFCRYFKKHTHHTLLAFINQVRINEACKKLVDKNYESISSVAYNSGFNSITNFNRVFKSIVKKSPKEYMDTYFHSTNQSVRVA